MKSTIKAMKQPQLGELIRALRQELELTQQQLSVELGVVTSTAVGATRTIKKLAELEFLPSCLGDNNHFYQSKNRLILVLYLGKRYLIQSSFDRVSQ